jgi:hypothetical protein
MAGTGAQLTAMIPPRLEAQIRANMEETKAQAILSACFERINQNNEQETSDRERARMAGKRLWWKEEECD